MRVFTERSTRVRGTQREYSLKPLKHSIIKRFFFRPGTSTITRQTKFHKA